MENINHVWGYYFLIIQVQLSVSGPSCGCPVQLPQLLQCQGTMRLSSASQTLSPGCARGALGAAQPQDMQEPPLLWGWGRRNSFGLKEMQLLMEMVLWSALWSKS